MHVIVKVNLWKQVLVLEAWGDKESLKSDS